MTLRLWSQSAERMMESDPTMTAIEMAKPMPANKAGRCHAYQTSPVRNVDTTSDRR